MAMVDVIDAAAVWRGLADGSIPAVVDLRNPEDRAASPFEGPPGTEVVAAPLWRVLDEPGPWAGRLSESSVAVCAQGHGAEMVAELLAEEGRGLSVLEGGMAAWNSLLVPEPLVLPGGSRLQAWQLLRPAKGCLSYVVGVPGEGAVVIDPARHPEPYRQVAAAAGMTIVAVVDTHLHADHVSGGPLLAAAVGAPYLLPSGERPEAAGVGEGGDPDEGGTIELCADEHVELLRLHLPGHTPGTTAVAVPGVFLAAGDTIFRGGVGRPDLTGQADELARQLYDSIHDRLAGMPPETLLLPAHWSSAAEIDAGGTVSAVLGDVLGADSLAGLGLEAFVDAVKASLSPAPESYDRIRAVNAGATADPEELESLDVGRNQCAAQMGPR
jgi:glyoxylase-like metal-dependent hydrolase (beta-lactamase superfamily II)/rhodanese-related sulfurtransferase